MKNGADKTPLGSCSVIGAKNQLDGKNLEEARGVESPFRRSSVITRSPPLPEINAKVSSGIKTRENNVDKLGKKITQLVDFLKPRNNIHKEIHSITREIQALFLQVSDELNSPSYSCQNSEIANKETQTEAWLKPQLQGTPKRGAKTQSPKGNKMKKKKNTRQEKATSIVAEPTTEDTNKDTRKPDTEPPKSEWKKVRPKAKKRQKPIKPDALVIKTCGDTSYADILKQVKRDPKLNVLGENVKNIRKTGSGELLLELNKPAHQNTTEFRDAIKNVLGTVAEVRALTHEVLLEIKDIDEITTKEDVYEALVTVSAEFNTLQPSAIKSMRKAYGGTQTATIGISSVLGRVLMQTAKIRIGWVVCRVREKITPIRCYKCLDFGHTAVRCRSPHDYSGSCIRCGEAGHKIKSCTKDPICLLCMDTASNSDHVTGSGICPQYRKAYRHLQSLV